MPEQTTGNVYDLGYQRYDGVRLGRRHAVRALYRESLRGAFGLGRRPAAKVAPVVLLAIALIPAFGQIVLGVFGGENLEVIRHEDYYALVTFVLILYVAVIAPDVVGRDRNNRTLSLYFTRAISRADYALAKLLALTSAMLLVMLMPQLLLFVGNGLVADSFGSYLREDGDRLLPILGTALLGAAMLGSIGAAVAAQTPHRAFATVGIIAAFLLPSIFAAVMVESTDSTAMHLGIYASPLQLLEGAAAWMFRVQPDAGSLVRTADFPLATYAAGAAVLTVGCSALLLRHYRTVQP